MARIRIVEAWLRCPTAPPSHRRAIMVMAEVWAEQRVLMRAYADSPDQTRPTILLHGAQFAIGPAGTDPHGPWGIHVEPPADGRAQALRAELELAARRLAGSKGNPSRLVDEESSFDRQRTNHWAPGAPRALPAPQAYYEPNEAAGSNYAEPRGAAPAAPAWSPMPASGPQAQTVLLPPRQAVPAAPTPPATGSAPREWSGLQDYPPTPPASADPPIEPHAGGSGRSGTVFGFARSADGHTDAPEPPPAAAPRGAAPPRRAAAPRRRFSSMVGRTMPLGLRLTAKEQEVLNVMEQARAITAARVAALVGTADGAAWMEALIAKLAACGLDLIVATRDAAGAPMYALRG